MSLGSNQKTLALLTSLSLSGFSYEAKTAYPGKIGYYPDINNEIENVVEQDEDEDNLDHLHRPQIPWENQHAIMIPSRKRPIVFEYVAKKPPVDTTHLDMTREKGKLDSQYIRSLEKKTVRSLASSKTLEDCIINENDGNTFVCSASKILPGTGQKEAFTPYEIAYYTCEKEAIKKSGITDQNKLVQISHNIIDGYMALTIRDIPVISSIPSYTRNSRSGKINSAAVFMIKHPVRSV